MTQPLPRLIDCRGQEGTALVYVLDADQGTKIGITIGTIEDRIIAMSRASGLPPAAFRVVRTYAMPSRERANVVERNAIWLLQETRRVGEWFHCHPLAATAAVEAALPLEWAHDIKIAIAA